MAGVFVDIGMSLDGYIAGPNGGPDNPLGNGGTRIHEWIFEVESWRQSQGMEGARQTSTMKSLRRRLRGPVPM